MYTFIKKIEHIADKIMLIIRNIVIPVCIAIILCNIIAQWYGIDMNSYKVIQFLGFDRNKQDLTVLLVLYIGAWIIYDVVVKQIKRKDVQKDEYRKYLIKELGEEGIKDDCGDDENCGKSVTTTTETRKTEKKDIIALMLKNNDEITEYFKISKSQAKSSFWFSVISCIVGLMALVVGIYGIVILKDISVSVISLISGSISELISGTVFWVHNKSALQLNHYYDALHENEKFLSAVNIADRLSDEKREEVLVRIIHKQISSETSKIEGENTKKGRNTSENDT